MPLLSHWDTIPATQSSSHYRIIPQSHYPTVTLSHCHIIQLSHYPTITLSHYHTIPLPLSHPSVHPVTSCLQRLSGLPRPVLLSHFPLHRVSDAHCQVVFGTARYRLHYCHVLTSVLPCTHFSTARYRLQYCQVAPSVLPGSDFSIARPGPHLVTLGIGPMRARSTWRAPTKTYGQVEPV